MLALFTFFFFLASFLAPAHLLHMSSATLLPYLHRLKGNYKVILASASPRRKELLALMGISEFEVIVSTFPENLEHQSFSHPSEYCLNTAIKKVEDVVGMLSHRTSENLLVIGADTIVSLDNQILEKPKDLEDAKRILSMLNGRQHTVYTGVVVFGNGFSGCEEPRPVQLLHSFTEATEVSFANLTEDDVNAYVDTKEGMDKAGSYGIQGIGSNLVRKIDGCYFNVMGLPVPRLSSILATTISKH